MTNQLSPPSPPPPCTCPLLCSSSRQREESLCLPPSEMSSPMKYSQPDGQCSGKKWRQEREVCPFAWKGLAVERGRDSRESIVGMKRGGGHELTSKIGGGVQRGRGGGGVSDPRHCRKRPRTRARALLRLCFLWLEMPEPFGAGVAVRRGPPGFLD